MKRFSTLLIVVALLAAGSLFAQNDAHVVTVNAAANQRIDVDLDVTLDLTDGDSDGLYDMPDTDASSTLSYGHNGSAAKKITALGGDNAGGGDANDMTLTVSDGTTTYTVVNAGVTNTTAADFITGIARGNDTATLTYSVSAATFAGTPAGGAYVFDVTFTITNP